MGVFDEARAAAKKSPGSRTTAEQALVDRNLDNQSVKNADFEARRHAKIYGDKKR